MHEKRGSLAIEDWYNKKAIKTIYRSTKQNKFSNSTGMKIGAKIYTEVMPNSQMIENKKKKHNNTLLSKGIKKVHPMLKHSKMS